MVSIKGKSLALLVLVAPLVSTAAEIDVGVGISKFEENNPLLWRTPGFAAGIKKLSGGGSVGITENLWENEHHQVGVDLREGFSYLGKTSIEAESPNHNTNTVTGNWIGPDFIGANPSNLCSGPCTNLAHFSGHGKAFGFPITLQPYYMVNGFKVSAIGGVFIGRNIWEDTATHIWNGVSYWDVKLHNDSKWQVSPTFGASVQRDHITLKYEYFRTPGRKGDRSPSPASGTHMISIHYSF